MSWFEILRGVAAVYIITIVLTASSLFEPVRYRLIKWTPWLQTPGHPHFVECRLCVGFWVSCLVTYYFGYEFTNVLVLYGVAHFLVMMEHSNDR